MAMPMEEEQEEAREAAARAGRAALRRHHVEMPSTSSSSSSSKKPPSSSSSRERVHQSAASLGPLALRLRSLRRALVAAGTTDVEVWEASADVALHAREPAEYLVVASALVLDVYPAVYAAEKNYRGSAAAKAERQQPKRWREIAGGLVIYFGICAPAPLELSLLLQRLPPWMLAPLATRDRATSATAQTHDAFASAMRLLRAARTGGQGRLLLLRAWEREACAHHRLLIAVAAPGAVAAMRRGIALSICACYRQMDVRSLAALLGLETGQEEVAADALEAAGSTAAAQRLRALVADGALNAEAATLSFVR